MNSEDRPRVGVCALIIRNGKILLGKRLSKNSTGSFQLPGGHLEFNETLEDCAVREASEETGLKNLKANKIVAINNEVFDGKHYLTIGILVSSKKGEPTNPEPNKSTDWHWYNPKRLPKPLFLPSKRVIDLWKAKRLY